MTKLPVVSGRDLVKALAVIGYMADHQSGSHIILRHYSPPHRRLTIPNHKEVAQGTLKHILKGSWPDPGRTSSSSLNPSLWGKTNLH